MGCTEVKNLMVDTWHYIRDPEYEKTKNGAADIRRAVWLAKINPGM